MLGLLNLSIMQTQARLATLRRRRDLFMPTTRTWAVVHKVHDLGYEQLEPFRGQFHLKLGRVRVLNLLNTRTFTYLEKLSLRRVLVVRTLSG